MVSAFLILSVLPSSWIRLLWSLTSQWNKILKYGTWNQQQCVSMTTISQVRFQWHRQRVTILPPAHILYNPYSVHFFLQLWAWVSSVQNFYIHVAESLAFLSLYISWDETDGHCRYLLVYMYSKLQCFLTCSNFRLGLCRKKTSLSI